MWIRWRHYSSSFSHTHTHKLAAEYKNRIRCECARPSNDHLKIKIDREVKKRRRRRRENMPANATTKIKTSIAPAITSLSRNPNDNLIEMRVSSAAICVIELQCPTQSIHCANERNLKRSPLIDFDMELIWVFQVIEINLWRTREEEEEEKNRKPRHFSFVCVVWVRAQSK